MGEDGEKDTSDERYIQIHISVEVIERRQIKEIEHLHGETEIEIDVGRQKDGDGYED